MEIPFNKTHITDDEISEVVDTLKSGWLTMGPKTLRFEEEFREYFGVKHSVAVNSGTAALHLALKAINLKSGDEVIIPTMTFTATGEVVCYFNAKPVAVDVDRGTHNLDVTKIEKVINKKTRAIIPVHYAGQPCDMDEIMQIAKKYKLYVIEDAAHALPAWYARNSSSRADDMLTDDKSVKSAIMGHSSSLKQKKRLIGSIGDITCFSFYATKTLSTGEGGMITTENNEWARKMKISRLHGISSDSWSRYSDKGSWYYEVVEAGHKYNMTDMQAGLGLVQLQKIEWMWGKRKKIAEKYTSAFKSIKEIITPRIKSDRETAWNLYVIKLNLEALKIDRNTFIEELKSRGISTSVHFIPLHRHPFYRDNFGYRVEDFPEAEWVYNRIISLPIYPDMTDKDIIYVIEIVYDICKKWRLKK